jgi:hypothetical protein
MSVARASFLQYLYCASFRIRVAQANPKHHAAFGKLHLHPRGTTPDHGTSQDSAEPGAACAKAHRLKLPSLS